MEYNNKLDYQQNVDAPDIKLFDQTRRQRQIIIGICIVVVLLLALVITSLIYLLHPNTQPDQVARIRDVFIIVMALESLLMGLVLTILIIQLARLINLLQNEVKPILDSTNETVNTLRGTTNFLSDNLVEPVIKLNEIIAMITRLGEILGGNRK
jgi:hypothetical protein